MGIDTCHGWGRRKIYTRILWGRLKKREHLEVQDLDDYTYFLIYE